MNKLNKQKFVLFLMLTHAAVAIPMAYFINIWIDEASTLYTTQNGFIHALRYALPNEKQAPLYFWIMGLWRELSHSVLFARLFSIICSLLAIKFFFSVARKFWDEKFSMFVTFFFAIHPYLFWASNEIRGYSLMILFTVLLFKFFCEGYWLGEEKTGKKARIFYIVIAILSLYANYYLGFFLVGGFAALLTLKRRRAARNYFLDMIVAGIFFLPMLFVIKSQFDVRTSDYVPPTYLIEGLKSLWNHFLVFVLPTEIYSSGETSIISVYRLWIVRLLALTVIILLFVKRKICDEKILVFGTISAVIFLFFLILYLLTGTLHIQIRHAAVVFVPILFLTFTSLWEIKPENSKPKIYYFASIAFVLSGFYVYSAFNISPNFTKRGDWARAAEFIEKNEKENQPIIVFSNYEVIALKFYYKGENKVLPNERFFDWNFEAKSGTQDTYKKQIEYVISQIPKDAEEIWLVTQEDCQIGEACEPLENFVESNYNVVSQKDLYLERIRHLKKK